MPLVAEGVDIESLVGVIWSTMLEMPLDCVPEGAEGGWSRPALQAQVHITGEWQGAVVLHASPALVERLTRRLCALEDQAPTLDDMQDAFGEMANMVGGNLKGILSDGEARLSLPTVVQGGDYCVRVPGSRQVARKVFSSDGQPFVVTILQADSRG